MSIKLTKILKLGSLKHSKTFVTCIIAIIIIELIDIILRKMSSNYYDVILNRIK